MNKTKESILKKIDLVMLTRNLIDRNSNVSFQLFLSEREMRLIKMKLNQKKPTQEKNGCVE